MTDSTQLGRDPEIATNASAPVCVQTEPFFVFRIDRSIYAVHVRYVEHVSEILTTVPVPSAPSFFSGVVHLRGTIVAVVDLNAAIGRRDVCAAPSEQKNHGRRLVIFRVEGEAFGIEADAVIGVRSVDVSSVRAHEAAPLGSIVINGTEIVKGAFDVIEGVVLLLETEALRRALSGW